MNEYFKDKATQFLIFTALFTIAFLPIGNGQNADDDLSGPDLIVESIIFVDPDENHLNDGEEAKISIIYGNHGDVGINTSWTIEISDNGKTINRNTITGGIGPGETHYYNFTYPLREGDRTFRVILDPYNSVDEVDDHNNGLEVVVDVETPEVLIPWWTVCAVFFILLSGSIIVVVITWVIGRRRSN